jgi:AraC family transcriptional regulator of adaptative response / methylphosphotriester-DNA alkyltransferase methyltransferase
MNNEMWEAIIHNDSAFDGKFYYGVTTTGIFCRPSCKSKNPNKEHVRIFYHADQAAAENFRPCKRCRPDGKRLPDEEWIQHIAQFIEEHYQEPLTLSTIADRLHASPFHMHRTFKRVKGVTLSEYIQQKRIDAAKQQLTQTRLSIMDVAMRVGFPNAAHFSTVFQKKTGMSPSDYRNSFI